MVPNLRKSTGEFLSHFPQNLWAQHSILSQKPACLSAPEQTALTGNVDPPTYRVSSAVHSICHGANPDPAGCTWKQMQKVLCTLVQLVWKRKRNKRENIGVFCGSKSGNISLFYSYLGQEERGKTKTKLLYNTASSPSLPASCRSWHAGTRRDNCSVELCCSSEKKKDQGLTQGIHPFTFQSKARAPWDLSSWWPQSQD